MIDINERTKGKWHSILTQLGVDKKFLTKKNCPCPFCGGVDRFRWTDHNQRGGWICNKCGSGDGFALLKIVRQWDFKRAIKEIESILGLLRDDRNNGPNQAECLNRIRRTWAQGLPIVKGDPVDLYLQNRGINLEVFPKSLKFVPSLYHESGSSHPTMLSALQAPDGRGSNLQRLYLTKCGSKADLTPNRMIMRGGVPSGSAIRLFPAQADILGVSEGVETALRASMIFDLPVWAAYSAGNLKQFIPPPHIRNIHIFGDNDDNFVGQSAAYELARLLSVKADREKVDLKIEVHLPDKLGTDWAD